MSAISRFTQLPWAPEAEEAVDTVLGKHKRNLERQLGSGSYTSVVYIFTWKLSRRRCSQPRPLLTLSCSQAGERSAGPAFLARGPFLPPAWGAVTVETTGVLVIRSPGSRLCFHACSEGRQLTTSLLPVGTVLLTEKQTWSSESTFP